MIEEVPVMAREDKIWEYVREAGYQPLENRCIIVKPAPDRKSVV